MLEKFTYQFNIHFLIPLMIKYGWRPPQGVPLQSIKGKTCFGYDDEANIIEALKVIQGYSMVNLERLASLWQQVKYLDRYGIQGDLVECGTWRGGSIGMMALAHLNSAKKPRRSLQLFDSFEGLPEPKAEKDGNYAVQYSSNRASGRLQSIGMCVGPLEDNKTLLEKKINYPKDLIKYHVGWFEDTLPTVAPQIQQIGLLRLDGDWYESTKICLDHLYSKVVKGGLVVIDDYGHWEGCRRAVDEFLNGIQEPVLLNHIDYTGRYWIKPY